MKKKITLICDIISTVLVIIFILKSITDYFQYTSAFNSAPFYVWLLVNALFLLLPAVIIFSVGLIIKKKQ